MQEPQKLVVCTLRTMPPETQRYLAALAASGVRLCNGFDELLPILNALITDTEDLGAWLSDRRTHTQCALTRL